MPDSHNVDPDGRGARDESFFARISTQPGVYLMKDHAGEVVYVGKAKNLRTRVRQYFRAGGDSRFFVAAGLLARVLEDIETVVVENEKEALLLENHLIKKHQPRFNVNLRDDKQYLVLRIDQSSSYPRVEVVRNMKDDGARYFGPYHSATSCRETLRTLNRHFQLRTCTDHVLKSRTRVCLQYQIKRCPGPCVHAVSQEQYGEQVDDVGMFLAGKNKQLVGRLRQRMREKSADEQFEAAAQLRDSLLAVEKSLAKQDVVQDQFIDQDVFGMWREGDIVELVVLFIRAGKLVGRRSVRQTEQEFSATQVMGSFVKRYYDTGTFVPDEVVVPVELEDAAVLADWLRVRRGRKVLVIAPQRGTRTRLVRLANKNAAAAAASRRNRDRDVEAALGKLQARLSLRRLPRRIECFDIAHIQGDQTVASRVVFTDGVADRSQYRKFKLRSTTNDDFASMYEVLTRRFKRSQVSDDLAWAVPDLLVIDGGKGQLASALAALTDLGVSLSGGTTGDKGFDVIGLAKERDDASGNAQPDRVFLRNAKDAIRLRSNTSELYLLSRVRDEAHRFANTFHRQRRRSRTLRSGLDDIAGIGPKRRTQLLSHFGSISGVRKASMDELAALSGMTRAAAKAIREHFDGDAGTHNGKSSAVRVQPRDPGS